MAIMLGIRMDAHCQTRKYQMGVKFFLSYFLFFKDGAVVSRYSKEWTDGAATGY